MTALREHLLAQSRWAYAGDAEMSLLDALDGLTPEELVWRADSELWTIGEILYHVASTKIEYCQQGFGAWQGSFTRCVDDLPALLELLDRAQFHLLECLQSCDDDALQQPVRTHFHGESAASFFGVMLAHDIAHAAQIRGLRRRYGSRAGGFYPV
ncbi:MAG: DinB family protein [Candidatus Krumholzibacteriia bacterium]|nr:DinB family protein [Candidatus Latescibacterota bacterium]